LGNYRFLGANDNLKKRAEEAASYFSRLKANGIDIAKHLLVPEYAADPSRLRMTTAAYADFRSKRTDLIVDTFSRVINPEL
jgi:hypothetical protein